MNLRRVKVDIDGLQRGDAAEMLRKLPNGEKGGLWKIAAIMPSPSYPSSAGRPVWKPRMAAMPEERDACIRPTSTP